MIVQFKWFNRYLCVQFMYLICLSSNADSLWLNGDYEDGLFVDKKARRRGDIVNVSFDGEEIKITPTADTSDPKTKYPLLHKVFDWMPKKVKVNLPVPHVGPEEKYTPNNMAMQVTDVLPNGNLVLEGIRKYKFFDKYQFEVIRGIARPEDIDDENTLPFSMLANLTIDYGTGNSIEGARHRGIVTKVEGALNIY